MHTQVSHTKTRFGLLVFQFSPISEITQSHKINFYYLYLVVIEDASVGCGRGYRSYYELLRSFISAPAEYSARNGGERSGKHCSTLRESLKMKYSIGVVYRNATL